MNKLLKIILIYIILNILLSILFFNVMRISSYNYDTLTLIGLSILCGSVPSLMLAIMMTDKKHEIYVSMPF